MLVCILFRHDGLKDHNRSTLKSCPQDGKKGGGQPWRASLKAPLCRA